MAVLQLQILQADIKSHLVYVDCRFFGRRDCCKESQALELHVLECLVLSMQLAWSVERPGYCADCSFGRIPSWCMVLFVVLGILTSTLQQNGIKLLRPCCRLLCASHQTRAIDPCADNLGTIMA